MLESDLIIRHLNKVYLISCENSSYKGDNQTTEIMRLCLWSSHWHYSEGTSTFYFLVICVYPKCPPTPEPFPWLDRNLFSYGRCNSHHSTVDDCITGVFFCGFSTTLDSQFSPAFLFPSAAVLCCSSFYCPKWAETISSIFTTVNLTWNFCAEQNFYCKFGNNRGKISPTKREKHTKTAVFLLVALVAGNFL